MVDNITWNIAVIRVLISLIYECTVDSVQMGEIGDIVACIKSYTMPTQKVNT